MADEHCDHAGDERERAPHQDDDQQETTGEEETSWTDDDCPLHPGLTLSERVVRCRSHLAEGRDAQTACKCYQITFNKCVEFAERHIHRQAPQGQGPAVWLDCAQRIEEKICNLILTGFDVDRPGASVLGAVRKIADNVARDIGRKAERGEFASNRLLDNASTRIAQRGKRLHGQFQWAGLSEDEIEVAVEMYLLGRPAEVIAQKLQREMGKPYSCEQVYDIATRVREKTCAGSTRALFEFINSRL